MLPPLLECGVLPDGIHEATWAEVCDTFGSGARRGSLLAGLLLACQALAAAGCVRLWLDGSFVTAKAQPRDYDACWDPAGMDPERLDPVLLDWSPVGRVRMRSKYLGDLFIAGLEGRTGLPFVDFFRKDREGGAKGIVVFNPGEAP